jgi:hypothetical protein
MIKKERVEKLKTKPNRTWYPRFLSVENRMEVLNDVRRKEIGNKLVMRLADRYDKIRSLKQYAKNRHRFIVDRGWWSEEQRAGDED